MPYARIIQFIMGNIHAVVYFGNDCFDFECLDERFHCKVG